MEVFTTMCTMSCMYSETIRDGGSDVQMFVERKLEEWKAIAQYETQEVAASH